MSFPSFACFFFLALTTVGAQLPGLPEELAKLIEESNRPVTTTVEKLVAADPLGCALILSRGIPGDLDRTYEYQYRIGVALLKTKRSAEALRLAESMNDYRAGLLFLNIAEDLLTHGGDRPLAIQLIQRTEQQVPNHKPWQQEILRGRLYLAGELLEWQNATLNAFISKVTDKGVLMGTQVLSLVRKQIQSGMLDEAGIDRLLVSVDQPVPEILEASRALFRFAHQTLLKEDEGSTLLADRLLTLGITIAEKSQVPTVDLYLEVACDLAKAGFEPKSMMLYRACKQRFGGDTEGVALTQYHLAHLWQLRGKGSEMQALLKPFEAKIRGMRQMDQPFGLAWMAAAWRVIGQNDLAGPCMASAVQAAETNINPRMRFLGLIEICLSYAETNRPLEAAILESMDRIRTGTVPVSDSKP